MRQLQTDAWPHKDTETRVHVNYYEVLKLKKTEVSHHCCMQVQIWASI